MDIQYDKRTRTAQRRLENGNTHRFTQNSTKKISNRKTPSHDGIHSFWFKKFTSIHNRLALEMNKCLKKSICTRMDDQRKDRINPKGPKQSNCPKQLQTHNLPCDVVENINCTNNLLFTNKPPIVPWGTERKLPQRNQRHSSVTLHKSAHPKRE